MKKFLAILCWVLVLDSLLVVSGWAQGYVSFQALHCGQLPAVLPGYEVDEEGDAHHQLQLQFADGTPIGEPVALNCLSFIWIGTQSVEGVEPGHSTRLRAVVFDSDDNVIAATRTVPIVMGTRSDPAELFHFLWNLDADSVAEDPIDAGLCFWVEAEPPSEPEAPEQSGSVFGPQVRWIPALDLFGTSAPWITHGGLKGPVAWGDLDGDGDLDFITPAWAGGYRCLLQQPDGTFLLREGDTRGSGESSVALADFDGDGDLDAWFYFGSASGGNVRSTLWVNQGEGRFEASEQSLGSGAFEILVDDLDGDGDADVITFKHSEIAATPGTIDVWKNDGTGQFERHRSGVRGCDVTSHYQTLADVNGDTFPDLLFMCFGSFGVHFNRGDGRFRGAARYYGYDTGLLGPAYWEDPRVADLDGDGDLDVLLHNGNIASTLWFNDGEGRFSFAGALPGHERQHATIADIDGDGDEDIAMGTRLYRNLGDCRFSRGKSPIARAFELVDADNDGFDDLLYVTEEGVMLHRGGRIAADDVNQLPGVAIPDFQFRRVIAEALGQEFEDPISAQDIARLERLDFSRSRWGFAAPPVQDLTGLEHAVNLEELDFTGVEGHPNVVIERFELPDSLTKLKVLKLSNNQLQGISLPDVLPALETLDLSVNLLSSVTLTGSLNQLKTLMLQRNRLTEVNLEASLSSLRAIDLRQNQLTELRLNVGMPALNTLELRDNNLGVVLLPSDASRLRRIDLTGSSVRELRLPQDASRITELNLSGPWPTADLSVFGRLTGLKTLGYIEGHFDPSQFGPLPNLERLSLRGNKARSFRLPRGYQRLNSLNVDSSVTESFVLPNDLHRLRSAFLAFDGVTELIVPEGLTSLEILSIGRTSIRELRLSDDMGRLKSLSVYSDELLRLVVPDGVGADHSARRVANVGSPKLVHVTLPEGWTRHINTPLITMSTLGLTNEQQVEFEFSSAHRHDVVIERSHDLRTWEPLREYRKFIGERMFRGPMPEGETQMFYRIRTLDP